MIAQTSRQSYHDLKSDGELGRRQQEALSLVRLHPGKTAMELAKIAGWADPNRVRPRLVELAQAGHIEPAGNRTCAVTGKMCMTWRVKQTQEQGELFEP